MSWEAIAKISTTRKTVPYPVDGISVSTRAIAGSGRYIAIVIGADLARRTGFQGDEQKVELALGTGEDVGWVRVLASESGGFLAKIMRKSGHYVLNIAVRDAEGLFALDFPRFDVGGINAASNMFVFKPSPEMLDVRDDGE